MKTPEVREKLESSGLRFVSDDRTTPKYLAGFRQKRNHEMGRPHQVQQYLDRLKSNTAPCDPIAGAVLLPG